MCNSICINIIAIAFAIAIFNEQKGEKMTSYKLFLNMLVEEIAKDKNFRGIIYERKDNKIISFSYINEIETFFVSTEYEDSDVSVITNDMTKKEIIKAYQKGNLYMFDFLDDVSKYKMEQSIESFFEEYFKA